MPGDRFPVVVAVVFSLPAALVRNRGVPEISQALSGALPSYNVNRKRRQSAASININATIDRLSYGF